MNARLLVMLTILGLVTSCAWAQTVRFVDAQGQAGGTGLSWDSPFADLQEAIEASTAGDEIWVRAGMYHPSLPAPGSTNAAYLLRDGVSIYGGFAGTETIRSQRDSATNLTILSALENEQISHIFEGRGIGPATVIDGLRIQDCVSGDDAIGGVGGAGGGMLLIDSSPTIVDCVFSRNQSRIGSGVYIQDGSPAFLRCVFESHTSHRSGEGGGIYSINTNPGVEQTLTIDACVFRNNTVVQGHWATGNGAGIFVTDGVILSVRDSSFRSNYGFHNNTFGNATAGGAITILGDGALIENSSFITNYSNRGAGIYSAGDIQVIQCLFVGNRAVGAMTCGGFDCPTDVPDVDAGYGGAIDVNYWSVAEIVQCTIAYNWSAEAGGGVYASGSIGNSILWGNRVPQPCCGEDQIPHARMQSDGIGNMDIEYSCVEGLFTPADGEDPPNPSDFPGSTEADPQFIMPTLISAEFGWLLSEIGDHRLVSGSPAVDAGDNALVPAGLLADFDGFDRFVDDPQTPDTGAGNGAMVDMGAYELQVVDACRVDLNSDGDLNFFDVSAFLAAFSAGESAADFTDDGVLNFFDVSAFLSAFAAGCP